MIMVAKETNLSIPTFVWHWLKTTMKSTLLLLLFFGSIHCNVENKISKVICSLCPSKDVDFLKGSLANPVKLSKDLFKECNISVRNVYSDVSDFGKKNLVSSAFLDKENKETLWLAFKSYCIFIILKSHQFNSNYIRFISKFYESHLIDFDSNYLRKKIYMCFSKQIWSQCFLCQDVKSMVENSDVIVKSGLIFVDQAKVINDLPTKINQDIKFVDMQTWKVYEH